MNKELTVQTLRRYMHHVVEISKKDILPDTLQQSLAALERTRDWFKV